MTNKSLLTQQDIKNFIYETIQQLHPRKNVYYCIKQLSKVFNKTLYAMKRYAKMGMPYVKYGKVRRYNINKVIEWFNKNNIDYEINDKI